MERSEAERSGGQNRFGIPFSGSATHFRAYFSGDWDVHSSRALKYAAILHSHGFGQNVQKSLSILEKWTQKHSTNFLQSPGDLSISRVILYWTRFCI